jgi:peptidoglycan/xylan/chitin deacetylase (PgdA/CDA1 family)
LPTVVAAFAGKDITQLPTTQHVVALTFDAGANADAVPEILATLHDEGVPGTFFLTGAWVRRYPAQTAEIAQHYPVGSHSDTHPYFTKLTNAELQSQLDNARQSITAATGHDPRPLFRFPFGDRDTRTRDFVNSQGYVSVFWTVDTLGWEGTSGGQSVASVVNRVTSHLRPGEIVLMHVGSHPTDHSTLDGDALRTVIDHLKAAGYGFVTVPQGLGLAH